MYDSITSNLARLIRRRWYVLVAAIAVGALAGLALSSSSSTDVSARFDVRFAPPFDLTAISDSDRVVDVEPVTIAAQATLDFAASPASDGLSATFAPNAAARSIRVTVTGADHDATEDEAELIGAEVEALATEPRLTQIDLAIGAADEQISVLQARGAGLDEAISTLAIDDLSRPTLLAQSVEAGRDITDAEVARLNLVAYRTYVEEDLVSSSAVEFSSVSAGVTSVVVGALVAGILALLVLFCIVLLDRRLRRRIHLERFAPGAEIVAVSPSAYVYE